MKKGKGDEGVEGKEGENLVESAIWESTCLDQRVIAFQHFIESMTAGTSTVKPYTNFDLSRVGPSISLIQEMLANWFYLYRKIPYFISG